MDEETHDTNYANAGSVFANMMLATTGLGVGSVYERGLPRPSPRTPAPTGCWVSLMVLPYLTSSLGDCTVFTPSYWPGRYYGMITEAESGYYTRKTPDVTISTGSSSISVTVKDGIAPLARMIADFYENGAYIGRVRTDASGVATLTHTATGTITAIVGERLTGSTMYNYTEA